MSDRKNHSLVLVQSFGDQHAASDVVRSLLKAGFSTEEISVVFKPAAASAESELPRTNTASRAEDARTPITELLSGAQTADIPGVGVVIGGPLASKSTQDTDLAHALRELGIGSTEAANYRRCLEAGETVVIAVVGHAKKRQANLRS